MELTVIALTVADPSAIRLTDGAGVIDLLWAAATPGERLQHVSIRVRPNSIHLGMFTVATRECTARAAALAICRHALVMSPLLDGWRMAAEPTPPRFKEYL